MRYALAIGFLIAVPIWGQAGRATRPKIERPDGATWEVIRKNCTSCHGIDDYAFHALDKAGWQKLVAEKHKPEETALSAADQELLYGWLVERFGPGSNPFPRTYVPPEITTFFSDPEAFRMMDRTCTRCHALEKVQEARKDTEEWRVTLVNMRERGAQISDEELERLVEWLARVWGTNRDK